MDDHVPTYSHAVNLPPPPVIESYFDNNGRFNLRSMLQQIDQYIHVNFNSIDNVSIYFIILLVALWYLIN